MSRGTERTISLVDPLRTVLPLMSVRTCRWSGSVISSAVTIAGPSGQKVSKPLALAHWPSLFWMSRAETSLAAV